MNNIWGRLGTSLGSGIGQGISSGLEQIAQRRSAELSKKQFIKDFTDAGLSPEEAALILNFPANQRLEAFQLLASRNAPYEPSQANFQDILNAERGAPLHTPNISELLSPQMTQKILQQPPAELPSSPKEEQASSLNTQLEKAPRKLTAAEKLAQNGGLTAKEARKEKMEEQKRIDKELKPYLDKIRTEKDAADFSQPRLNKMKQLIKKGNLPVSSIYNVLKNIEDHVGLGSGAAAGAAAGAALGALGGPIGVSVGTGAGSLLGAGLGALIGPISSLLRHAQKTTSPDTESFEKLSASFLRGAKDIFGGRFTNEEMKAYLASIPTLAQTDKGKLDVINDMELFNKAAKIKYNAAQKIIKQNGGRPPANLPELVENEVRGKLDDLSEIFREENL